MAVEIITPGILPEDRKYTATCSRCACKFKFLRGDAELVHDQRDGDYLRIGCPTCYADVNVSARLPPMGVMR